DIANPSQLQLHWIVGVTDATDALLQHFQALPSTENAFYWLAGEDRIVVQLRRHVRRERGCARNQMYAVPYWRAGLTEEAYHHK
ncbi:SIP domain-containing protein, partial [Pectobacterium carotovorum]|uniref:SIP domain-containing protein n=1 Tax=Pectobacterium carotovorum TaxID=554 RepID=UPI0010FEAEB5